MAGILCNNGPAASSTVAYVEVDLLLVTLLLLESCVNGSGRRPAACVDFTTGRTSIFLLAVRLWLAGRACALNMPGEGK